MSMTRYAVNEIGILINPDSYDFVYLCNKLRKLAPELNYIENDIEFIYEIKDINIDYKINIDVIYIEDSPINDIDIYTLKEDLKTYHFEDVIVLQGQHRFPTLTQSPFRSKYDCINHYKEIYGELLPEDFDYENNIGEISYSLFG